MTMSRRSWLQTGLAAGALAVARKRAHAQEHQHGHAPPAAKPAPTGKQRPPPLELPPPKPTVVIPRPPAGERYTPLIGPDGRTLPFEKRNGA